jgi:hypothetical protein
VHSIPPTSDKDYQSLVHGRWFFPSILAFSTIKPGRHDIAEILLKVALSTINQIKKFTKPGANPRRIDNRCARVVR